MQAPDIVKRFTRAALIALTCSVLHPCDCLGEERDINILTFHGDSARLGWNAREISLTPGSVSPASFGKIWERALDGQVYASPLYVSGLVIKGRKHDVVFAATQNNSVYALDAGDGSVLWSAGNIAPALDELQFNECTNIWPRHGITSTPVIDLQTGTIYAVGVTQRGIRQTYEVWALDIRTGAMRPGWPVTLAAKYKNAVFDGGQLTQRGALNLVNGWLYVPFGSRCDIGDWKGWVVSVNVDRPGVPQRAFAPAPTVPGGGIWGSGGVSADQDGNIYVVVGNGTYDLPGGGDNVCQSVVRLHPDDRGLVFTRDPADYYVPENFAALDQFDVDLGGSTAIVVPGAPKLLVTAGKDGFVYALDRDHLGGLGGALYRRRLFGDPGSPYHSSMKTTPAYFDGGAAGRFVYVTGNDTGPEGQAGVVALKITDSKPPLAPAWTLTRPLFQPGAPTVSSNGPRDAIVWVIESNKDDGDYGPSGVLHAFDAVTGATLYKSNDRVERDELKDARKFSCPIVAKGRVYVGTHGIVAYGLLKAGPQTRPANTGIRPIAFR